MDHTLSANRLRSLALSQVVLLVVWLLSWPQLVQDLSVRSAATHLVAWLGITEQIALGPLPDHTSEYSRETKTVWPFSTEYRLKGKHLSDEKQSPGVEIEGYGTLTGFSISAVVAEKVTANPLTHIPYSDYLVWSVHTSSNKYLRNTVYHKNCLNASGTLSKCIPHSKPALWETSQSILNTLSDKRISSPSDLRLESQLVAKFIAEVQGQRYTVLGFQLEPGLFYYGSALALFSIAAGAALCLPRPEKVDLAKLEPWPLVPLSSFAYASPGSAFILVLSIAWALAPLAQLLTLRYGVNHYYFGQSALEQTLYTLSHWALLLTIGINLWVAHRLAALRTRRKTVLAAS